MQKNKLIMAIISKNEKVFESVYNQYYQLIFYIIHDMVRNREDALELTQDVFLTVYNKIGTYQGGSFKYWIIQIAKNHALNFIERVQSKQNKIVLNNELVFGTKQETAEPFSKMDEVLSKHFSEEGKRIIVLKIVFDMTFKEIADEMELSQSYVYRHYKSSLGILKLVKEVFE
jgi:RNA polymerase sigma-70 factor, ECF subfamily